MVAVFCSKCDVPLEEVANPSERNYKITYGCLKCDQLFGKLYGDGPIVLIGGSYNHLKRDRSSNSERRRIDQKAVGRKESARSG